MIPQSKQMEEDNTDDFLNPLNVCESEDEGEEETINQSSTLSPDTSANGRKSSTNCVVNDPPLETMRLPEDQDKGEIFSLPFHPNRHLIRVVSH